MSKSCWMNCCRPAHSGPGEVYQLNDSKRSNLLPVVAQANLDAGQPFDVAAYGPRTGRRNLHLRQDAYASAVNYRGSQLAYSSLEFNFALQFADDLSNSLTIGIP